jgi:hypothetical protein
MGISGPISTVHYEHICRELAAVTMNGLATRGWLSDRSRSAAVVLGNHPISVEQICIHRKEMQLLPQAFGELANV